MPRQKYKGTLKQRRAAAQRVYALSAKGSATRRRYQHCSEKYRVAHLRAVKKYNRKQKENA